MGDLLTFSLDANSSGGAFVTDYTTSFDLSESRFSFLDDTDSRLFFGSQGAGASFDALSISVAPEPGTSALLAGFAALGFGTWRRRRRLAIPAGHD